jgi:type I restriction enzyme S subunit
MKTGEMKKLKYFIKGFFDGPHATPKDSETGAIFLGIKNVTEDGRLDLTEIRHIAEEDMPRWTKRVTPQAGDIVFSYEATLHRYAMIPKGFYGCLGRRMALLRVDEDKADKKFLLHYFLSPFWRTEVEKNILSGATVDRIPLTKVPDFEVNLPELPTQKRIASILTAYDDLIENNLKRIKLLEESLQLVYEITSNHKDVKEKLVYPEYCNFIKGSEPGSDNYTDNNVEKNTPFLRVGDLGARNSEIFVDSKLNGLKFTKKDDILVSLDGTIGIVRIGMEGAYSSGIRKVVCNNSLFKGFTYAFLKSINGQNQIKTYAKGSTILHASSAIPKLKFRIAINSDTEVLLNELNSMLVLIINLTEQNDKLKQSRDILLPRLMSGTINVA